MSSCTITTHKHETLEGQDFAMEDHCFVHCRLIDCDLIYSGGDFDWIDTTFENCRFNWRAEAASTVRLLNGLKMFSGQREELPLAGSALGSKAN